MSIQLPITNWHGICSLLKGKAMKFTLLIKTCRNCRLGFVGIKTCSCCGGVWWACPKCSN